MLFSNKTSVQVQPIDCENMVIYFLCLGAGTPVMENIGIEKVIKTEHICYISFEPINHKSYENTMLPADIVVLFKFKGAKCRLAIHS